MPTEFWIQHSFLLIGYQPRLQNQVCPDGQYTARQEREFSMGNRDKWTQTASLVIRTRTANFILPAENIYAIMFV